MIKSVSRKHLVLVSHVSRCIRIVIAIAIFTAGFPMLPVWAQEIPLTNHHGLPAFSGGDNGCGNGVLDLGETCDDGNLTNGDGCNLSCTIQPGFTCTAPVAPQRQNAVGDGSFEQPSINSPWTVSSANFGTPVCDINSCGAQGTSIPQSGQKWIWLGGTTNTESAFIEQIIEIANTDAVLSFAVAQTACDSPSDAVRILIDDNIVSTILAEGASCGTNNYRTINIDLANAPGGPYNDGFSHTLRLEGNTFATNGDISNFFIDDVLIDRGTLPGQPSVCNPSPNTCQMQRFDPALDGNFASIGWTTFEGPDSQSGIVWSTSDDGVCGSGNGRPGNYTGGSGHAACIDSDAVGNSQTDAYLCSDALDLTGLNDSELRFKFNYQIFGAADSGDRFELLIGTTAPSSGSVSTYTQLYTSEQPSQGELFALPGAINSVDLATFSGAQELYMCFRYSGQFDWSAQIDDVALVSDNCIVSDSDQDGVLDNVDNCTLAPNASQLDSNGDGIGNVCDADVAGRRGSINGDCVVNALDLSVLATAYLSSPDDANWNADIDLSGPNGQPDGIVNAFDLLVLKNSYFGPPGPSAGGCQ